jgi:hypothetical protein
MPIPDRELVPKRKPGPKPGSKSHPNEILKRVVQVGQMLHIQGMTLTEIYQWNMDPDRGLDPETKQPLPGGNPWGYGIRTMTEIVRKANALGASLLVKDYNTALRIHLRQLHDLKRKSIAGGDFRVAYLCIIQIAKTVEAYQGKIGRHKNLPGSRINGDFIWAEPKAITAGPAAADIVAEDMDAMAAGLGLS